MEGLKFQLFSMHSEFGENEKICMVHVCFQSDLLMFSNQRVLIIFIFFFRNAINLFFFVSIVEIFCVCKTIYCLNQKKIIVSIVRSFLYKCLPFFMGEPSQKLIKYWTILHINTQSVKRSIFM